MSLYSTDLIPLLKKDSPTDSKSGCPNHYFKSEEYLRGFCSICHRSPKILRRWIIGSFVFTLCIILLILVGVFANGPYIKSDQTFDINDAEYLTLDSTIVNVGKNGSVVLLGDSWLHHTRWKFGLVRKMDALTEYDFEYTDAACNSAKADVLIWRMLPTLIPNIEAITKPKLVSGMSTNSSGNVQSARENINSSVFVILLTNSDLDGFCEMGLSPAEIRTKRTHYQERIRYITQQVLNAGAYMVMSGPGIKPWYEFKGNVIRAYQRLNIEVANEFKMDYIDVRGALLGRIAKGRNPLMYDNEHPNNLGASIMARLFVDACIKWKRKL